MTSRAASIFREQPPTVWVLQLGMLVNFFGNGLVAPFLVLYLYLGRGVPLALAAAAIASGGIIAIASGFLAGWSADRFGPKFTLVTAMTSNAIAYALYLTVSEPWQAFVVAGLVGFGTGMYGPSGGWAVTMSLKTERGITLADNDLVLRTTTGRPLAGSYLDEGPFREVCRKAGIAYSTREQKGLRGRAGASRAPGN